MKTGLTAVVSGIHVLFWAQASLYVDMFLDMLPVGHSFLLCLFKCAIVYRPQISFFVSSLPNRAHILP